MDKYLPIFQKYSREFISKIHPDRHHGYEDVQKVNASATSIIHDLFKFDSHKDRECMSRKQFFDILFYLWNENKTCHIKLFHKLIHNTPFDCESGKSALKLFQSIKIPVDSSLIQAVSSMSPDPKSPPNQLTDFNDMKAKIKNSCIDFEADPDERLSFDMINFIRRYPNIQFAGEIYNSRASLINICRFLMPNIQKLERGGIDPLPIIIVSEDFSGPEVSNDVISLPLGSTFNGNHTSA